MYILRYKETHVISKKAKYRMVTKSKNKNMRRSGEKMSFLNNTGSGRIRSIVNL